MKTKESKNRHTYKQTNLIQMKTKGVSHHKQCHRIHLVFVWISITAFHEQTNRQTNKQTDKQANRQTDKQKNRKTEKQRYRQTEKQTNRQTDKQTNRQTDKLTN